MIQFVRWAQVNGSRGHDDEAHDLWQWRSTSQVIAAAMECQTILLAWSAVVTKKVWSRQSYRRTVSASDKGPVDRAARPFRHREDRPSAGVFPKN